MLRNTILALSISSTALIVSNAKAVDTLVSGQTLYQGQQIDSRNHCFRLIMQSDGNLVLYRNSNNQAIWASWTQNTGASRSAMQADGNFVVYTNNNVAKWSSGTWNNKGAWLLIQDDGNLVIYAANSWRAIWATNTVTHC